MDVVLQIGSAASANGGHRLEIADQVEFPHSLGLFYSAFTDFLGFEVNEGEYKVMGMAPYGEPRFVDELSRVLRTYEDGSFWLDLDHFSFHYSARSAYTDRLPALLGTGPRKRDEPFDPDWLRRGDEEPRKKPKPDEDEWPEEDELLGDEDDPTVYPLW